MRKLLFILAALCVTHISRGQAPVQHEIDGILNEWDTSSFTYDNDTKLSYAVSNDGDYLYVALKAKDKGTQMKLCRMGMSAFVDPKGKKRQSSGLSYPVPFGNPGGDPRGGSGGERPTEEMFRQRMGSSLLFYKVIGVDGYDDTKTFPVSSGSQGISVMGGWGDKNELVIEYAFPMELLGSLDKLANKEISIGFKVNGAASFTPTSTETSTGSAGGRGGGSGGRGNRGGGGSGSANVFASSPSASDQYVWAKYTIVKK
ncbi:MAG: hypothetical protein JWN76_1189 [Chitinophagaceae bacterium]|nr:hypothetical protein [Chitinophagaceae bacterium]